MLNKYNMFVKLKKKELFYKILNFIKIVKELKLLYINYQINKIKI